MSKIAHDFRVFFMGHKGSIEARYTTNKQKLGESLEREMFQAYSRCQSYLDQEMQIEDPTKKLKEQLQETVQDMTVEQLGRVQEMLIQMGVGKPRSSSG